jgi:hypothetical protein
MGLGINVRPLLLYLREIAPLPILQDVVSFEFKLDKCRKSRIMLAFEPQNFSP